MAHCALLDSHFGPGRESGERVSFKYAGVLFSGKGDSDSLSKSASQHINTSAALNI
jgi:hypothetical protein